MKIILAESFFKDVGEWRITEFECDDGRIIEFVNELVGILKPPIGEHGTMTPIVTALANVLETAKNDGFTELLEMLKEIGNVVNAEEIEFFKVELPEKKLIGHTDETFRSQFFNGTCKFILEEPREADGNSDDRVEIVMSGKFGIEKSAGKDHDVHLLSVYNHIILLV